MGQKLPISPNRKSQTRRVEFDFPKQIAELKELRDLVRRAEASQLKPSPSARPALR
jgi:hypothetical protein